VGATRDDGRVAVLGVLGPVELHDDAGGTIKLGGEKPRAVLAYLALHVGRTVSVSSLIDGVWGDSAPETAVNTLQVHVSSLRRALSPTGTTIERLDGGYRLSLPAASIDLHVFEAMVSEGRAALRSGHHERAHDVLARAVDLWRGRPFEGVEAAPFVESARPALESAFASASVEHAECLTALGRYDDAIVAAERLIARSPYDERGWATAMAAHYWAGRQSDALQCFQRARRLLDEELGLQPGPELVALERAVLDQTLPPPAGRTTATSASTPADATTPATMLPAERALVGRDGTVDQVVGWLGSGTRLVSLVGLGGIGKTSVATAVAHRIAAGGAAVRFVDLSAMTDAGTAAHAIARAVGVTVESDPLESVVGWASRADGVVVLDNLEQLQGASALVRSLLDAGGSVRLIATSRRALRLREEQLVALQPLAVRYADGAAGEATELFRMRAELVRADLDEIDEAVVTEICELTAGIPLGVELAALQLRALSPAQLLRRLQGFSSAAIDAPATDDYPERQRSLRAVLDSTVTLLADDANVVLTHAALIDGPITIELVESSCAERGIDALGHLGDLVESGLVRRVGDRFQVPPPVRQYVAATVPEDELGVAQDAVFARIDALASEAERHWYGADADRWRERLVADAAAIDAVIAGRVERGRFSELAELALRLGQYWLHESRLIDALVTLDALRAADLEPELAHRVRLLGGTFASYVNRADTAELLEPALRDATGRPDRLVVNAWCCLGAFHAHRHRHDETRRCAEGARAAAEISADPGLVALARDFAGYAAFYMGDTETAIRINLEAIEDARRQGDRHALTLLLASTAEALVDVGRFEEAGALAEEAFDLARDVDLGIALGVVLIMSALAQLELGRPAAAWGLLVEHLRFARDRYPDPLVVGDSLAQLAAVRAALGDDESAARTWGAATAIHVDQGIDPDRRRPRTNQRRLDATRERLGKDRFDALSLAGSVNPDRVIDAILADGQPGVQVALSSDARTQRDMN
jgi:DNA-binding SARP family transcriptional activator/predicted ATPase